MGLNDFEDSTYAEDVDPEPEEVGISIPVMFTFTKEMIDKGDIPEVIQRKGEKIVGKTANISDLGKVDVMYGEAKEIPTEDAEWD